MTFGDIDYALIKKWLPYGAIATLADEFKISRSQAYKILQGESKNMDLLEAAIKLAIENKMKFKMLEAKLKSV